MLRRSRAADGSTMQVTFSLPATHPDAPVSVVGNFNDWHPHNNPLVRRPDGTMSTTINVPEGTHVVFRYLGSNGVWFDEYDAQWVDWEGGHCIA